MSVLFIAVPLALAFALSAVIAFLWASRTGQLDDLDTPPLRMLHDDAQVDSEERVNPPNEGPLPGCRGQAKALRPRKPLSEPHCYIPARPLKPPLAKPFT